MRLLKNLLFEQYKNFRILLRNISSLLLLIIGPLLLILLVGFAYSGENLHDIKIGITSSNYEMLKPALENFSTYAKIVKYNNSFDCVKDLTMEKMHVCLEFSDDFGQVDSNGSGLVTGTITFYYDNSKKPLSTKVVDAISTFFGVEAEKVSIDSAKSILSGIKDFVGYVKSKNEDIYLLLNESQNIKQSLVERHAKLVALRDEFIPVYTDIKQAQAQLDNVSKRLDEAYSKYNESRSEVYLELAMLRMRLKLFDEQLKLADIYVYEEAGMLKLTDNIMVIIEKNFTYHELDKMNYSVNPEGLILNISDWENSSRSINLSQENSFIRLKLSELTLVQALDSFESSIGNFSNQTDEYYNYLKNQKENFDYAVGLVDEVKLMLDADIAATEEYITKIEVSVVKIEQIRQELNSNVKALSKLDPVMAEKLIKPFIQDYIPILPDISNIKQAYPGMIAIIIIFISILFANIVTLSEINSKAFFRNLLAPVNKLTFVFGLVFTTIIIVFFQIFVLLLVGYFNFGIDVFSVFWILTIIIMLLSLFFLILGMIIAILIRSEQSSVLTTTFVAMGFFLFSNSVTPIEIMPKLAGFFAALNPYVIATTAFRKVLIFGLGPKFLLPELMYLGAYLLIVLIVLVAVSLRKLKN